jgi:diguanylate cyclase (GGDEF)-like protein
MTESKIDLEQQLAQLRHTYVMRLVQELPQLQQGAMLLYQLSDVAWRDQVQDLSVKLHTLAGSAGTFGLPELGEQARQCELQLKPWLVPGVAVTTAEQKRLIDDIQQLKLPPAVADYPAAPAMAEVPAVKRAGVYLLCDEPALTEQISTMLDIFGYSYRHFSSVDFIAQAIANAPPEVLIVDLDMHQTPGQCMQGIADLQAKQSAAIPVLLLSHQSDFGSYLNAIRVGAIGYFVKPLNSTELEARLRQQLSRNERAPFRVMLVDDQLLAEHYALVLRQGGLLVEVLSEPALIFESLKQFHPDVILLDVNMPFCSGPELAQLVRLQQAWLGVPIIYLSSETDGEQQLAALIKAGDDFITKPITDTALLVAVFARAQRARQLADIMTRDSLTGLLQHAHIKERLALEMLRAVRSSQPVSVVMLDIDHFKKVNDNYGHLIGDQVIANLANLLKQQLRKTDLVGRYGGEEFLLVLPDCSVQRAFTVVEQVRELFAALPFTAAEQRFFCSFSAGICAATLEHADLVIDKADQALYRAKSSGRNCTILSG